MEARRLMAIGWSSFLAACLLEFLVFACLDPGEMHWFGEPLAWSHQAIYAAAFFAFWGVTAMASALAVLLMVSAGEPNAAPHEAR